MGGIARGAPAPRRSAWRRVTLATLALAGLALGFTLVWVYREHGLYGLNVVLRRGGSTWVAISPTDPVLPDAMRVALRDPAPPGEAGPFAWTEAAPGFEVAELPVLVAGRALDRVLLARIDPERFQFAVRTAPAGDHSPRDWMERLQPAFLINGSYYARDGRPDAPLLSAGQRLGPATYDARHGAFVVRGGRAHVVDLASTPWQDAFAGASDALISYPLLVAEDGSSRVQADGRWLANRSFVGEDRSGRIVLGTTQEAFFSLERLADFLRRSPLDLRLALNLDGGPMACQSVAVGAVRRSVCGRWETAVRDGRLSLLRWPYGSWALPIVLVATPR